MCLVIVGVTINGNLIITSAGTYSFTNVTISGDVTNSGGGTVTINQSGGSFTTSEPGTGAGQVNIVAGQATVTFEGLTSGGEFRVYDEDLDGNDITIGTDREGTESLPGTTYVLTHSIAEDGNIIFAQYMNPDSFEESVVRVVLSQNDQTITFNLTPEENN